MQSHQVIGICIISWYDLKEKNTWAENPRVIVEEKNPGRRNLFVVWFGFEGQTDVFLAF